MLVCPYTSLTFHQTFPISGSGWMYVEVHPLRTAEQLIVMGHFAKQISCFLPFIPSTAWFHLSLIICVA